MIILPVDLDARLTILWTRVQGFVRRNAQHHLLPREVDQTAVRTLEELVNQLETVENAARKNKSG